MYYFIVNPHSRSGKGLDVWNHLKKILIENQIPYTAYLTEHTGHATQLAMEISSSQFEDQEQRTIVAFGGDGTLNEVINGVRFSPKVSLGYIPCGSGNDFSRGMKIPRNPERALKSLIFEQHEAFLDYGILSYHLDGIPAHRRFIVSSGLGFDADVCRNISTSWLKKAMNVVHAGKMSYLFIGIKRIILCHGTSGYLILDDEKKIPLNRIRFISFHNTKYEGGGFCFAPKAVPDDGMINVCIVSDCSKGRMTKILAASVIGKHERIAGARQYTAHKVTVHLDHPYEVHTDGESCLTQTDISVQSECKKIRFVW